MARRRIDQSEIGVTGVNRLGGWVFEPQNTKLQGERGRKIFRQMSEEDAVIGAILFAIEMLIRKNDWPVVPGSNARVDKAAAKFIEEALADTSISFEDALSETLSMLVYGWAWSETPYKLRSGYNPDPDLSSRFTDGRIGWQKFAPRAQDTLYHWEMDDQGTVLGMIQMAPPKYIPTLIPTERSLHFRTTGQRGSPEGRSIILNAFRSWFNKRSIETIEGIGIERDIAGLPVAYGPPDMFNVDASSDDKAMLAALQKMVTNVRNDEEAGIVFPLEYDEAGHLIYDFKLLSTGGARQFDTNAIITRYDQRIAMVVLADFILLGHEGVGSKALSVSKVGVFTRALQAWCDEIASVFNTQAIPRLLRLNGMPYKELPKIKPGEIEDVDLAQLGIYVQQLSASGADLWRGGTNDELLKDLLRKAGLPDDLPPHVTPPTAPVAIPPTSSPDPNEPVAANPRDPAASPTDPGTAGVMPPTNPATPARKTAP